MPIVELFGAKNSGARSSYPGLCIHVMLLFIRKVLYYYISTLRRVCVQCLVWLVCVVLWMCININIITIILTLP